MKCCISRFCKNARWVAAGTFMLIFTTSCVRITLPLLSKSLAKADSKFTLPPASLLALENGQKIHHLKVSQLTQFKNGSGVVIAPPSSTASTDDSLGRGAARWLQWTLGGLPAFDKNASWDSYTESISYLELHELNSDAEAAAVLAANSGATDVAVGSLTGNKNHLLLSYQWRKFPGNKVTGKAISISGSPAEIVKQLPQLAETLSAQLGVKSTFKSPTESAAQLQDLGNLPLSPGIALSGADVTSLTHLATLSNIARVMYLDYLAQTNYNITYPSSQAQREWKQTATTLLNADPTNAQAWQYVSQNNGGKLWGNERKLIALAKKHPHNYLLHHALSSMYFGQHNLQLRRDTSQITLRCNHKNPRAWTQLVDTIFNEADSVRHACYMAAMNDEQQKFVAARYDECLPLLAAAAKLPHHSASTWTTISRIATFEDFRYLTMLAMNKALNDDPLSEGALGWAVQIFQPKWGGGPEYLLPVVERIVAHPRLYVRMFKSVNQAIYANGYTKGSTASQQTAIKILGDWIGQHPHDYSARSNYAQLISRNSDWAGVEEQESIILSKRPNDDVGYWLHADEYFAQKKYKEAGDNFKKALRTAPDNAKLHYMLGETYHRRGEFQGETNLYPQARAEYETALKEDPDNHQDTDAYNRLADLYIYVFNDPQKAIKLYGKAISLTPGDGLEWANLGHAHFLLDKKDLAKMEGKHAHELGYTGQHILWGELNGR